MDRRQEREAEPQEQQAPEEDTSTRITRRAVSVSRPQEEDSRQRITQRTVTVDRHQEREAESQEQVETESSITSRTESDLRVNE